MEDQINLLYQKFLDNTCTAQELTMLFRYFHTSDENELNDLIRTALESSAPATLPTAKETATLKLIRGRIQKQIGEKEKSKRMPLYRVTAAASVIMALSFGTWLMIHKKHVPDLSKNQTHDIAPGHKQATLTLANGQKIVLTKGLKGQLARQGNSSVQINDQHSVTYTNSGGTASNIVQYNTLSTAKGEQSLPLILADGSRVWLNSESSVTYPTIFTGKNRMVTITGEVYFEIAHNAAHPFIVNVKGQQVQDIGTEFNINSYDDEPNLKTTLLQGSVKLTANRCSKLLKPGEQAILEGDGYKITKADAEQVMAWKNGDFVFNGDDLKTVMRQLARWYDAQVEYRGNVSNIGFVTTISRNKNLSEVLSILQRTEGVHFKIEGRRIIVMP